VTSPVSSVRTSPAHSVAKSKRSERPMLVPYAIGRRQAIVVVESAPNRMSRRDPAAVEDQEKRTLQRYPMLAKPTTLTLTTPGTTSSAHVTRTEKEITRSGILICLIQHQLTRLLNLPLTVGPKTLPNASGMAKSSIIVETPTASIC
jgi:hypothetical protein